MILTALNAGFVWNVPRTWIQLFGWRLSVRKLITRVCD